MDIFSWLIIGLLDITLQSDELWYWLPVGLKMMFHQLEPWYWFIAGLALLSVELLVSGAYFLWIGAAALATGVVAYIISLHPVVQVILFAILAVILIWCGRKVRPCYHITPSETFLNRRSAQLIGQEFVLDEPIYQGKAQIQMGDSKWTVHGPNLPAGERVVIIRVEGVILIVESVQSQNKRFEDKKGE